MLPRSPPGEKTSKGGIMFRVSLVAALVAAVLAALAGTASAATPAASATPAAGAATAAAGTLNLSFVLSKVVASGKQLVAQGEVVGTVQTASGTQVVRKPFSAPIRSLTR